MCILRSVILKICKSAPELPTALSLEDFKKGQVEIPDLLWSFFTTLLTGYLDMEYPSNPSNWGYLDMVSK